MIYLDNASTSPVFPQVSEKICELSGGIYGNASSTHSAGRRAKVLLEEARLKVAKILGAGASEVFFTSGGTEGNNTVLKSARAMGVKRIISSPLEHHSVLSSLEQIEKENRLYLPEQRVEIALLGVDGKGELDSDEMEALLREGKRTLVSLMHANNETGNQYGIKKTGKLCREYSALFHTDAVQTVGRYKIDLSSLDVDFLSASAHKFGGPKGVGILYSRSPNILEPLLSGGRQERGLRAGTENVASIAAAALALEISCSNMQGEYLRMLGLKEKLIRGLQNIDGIEFNGNCLEMSHSLASVVNVSLPVEKSTQMLVFALDIAGLCVSGGSACMAGAAEEPHIIRILREKQGSASKKPSIRISLGWQNTEEDVRRAIEIIKSVL